MSRKHVKTEIEKKCKEIKKLSTKVVNGFEKEDIHAFRVTVKKLRALLRMLNENKDQKELKIPGGLKAFYNCVGMIRNVQLFIHTIKNEKKEEALSSLIQRLEAQKDAYKIMARQLTEQTQVLKKKKLLKKINTGISKRTVHRFIKRKQEALHKLISAGNTEVNMHAIRKILKDILYNWKFIQRFGRSEIIVALQFEQHIQKITSQLGDIQDVVTFREILNYEELKGIDEGAAKEELIKQLTDSKEQLKLPILVYLERIKSDFENSGKAL